MAVKYHCPKCGRRFAEWGAEKLSFQCPHDDQCPHDAEGEAITLVRQGSQDEKAKPSLKRKAKAKRTVAVVAAPISSSDDDDDATGDGVVASGDFEDVDVEDEEDVVEEVADEDEEEEVGVRRPTTVIEPGFDEEAEDDEDAEEVPGEDVEDLDFGGEAAAPADDFEEER